MLLKLDLTEPEAKRYALALAIEFYRAGGAPSVTEWRAMSDSERAVYIEARERVQAAQRVLDVGMASMPPQQAADLAADMAEGRTVRDDTPTITDKGAAFLERAIERRMAEEHAAGNGEITGNVSPDEVFRGTLNESVPIPDVTT